MRVYGRFTHCVKLPLLGRLRVCTGVYWKSSNKLLKGLRAIPRSIQGLHPHISHLEYWKPVRCSMTCNSHFTAEVFVCLYVILGLQPAEIMRNRQVRGHAEPFCAEVFGWCSPNVIIASLWIQWPKERHLMQLLFSGHFLSDSTVKPLILQTPFHSGL